MNVNSMFRQYSAKAATASRALDDAIAQAPADPATAVKHADAAGSGVSVLTGAGSVESGFLFGKFLAPRSGGLVGRLFSTSDSARQARVAEGHIAVGIREMRAENAGGATEAWSQARLVLDAIARR